MALIWVVGELNVDIIVQDKNLAPEPGKEKLVEECRLALGSSSAITAAAAAGLGHEVRMVSVVGSDRFGRFVLEELEKLGIDTTYVTVSDRIRTGVTVSLSDGRDRALLTYAGSIGEVSPAYIPEAVGENGDHLHFGSYFLQTGMRGHWADLLRRAKSRGMTTSFDTGWDVSGQWQTDEIGGLLAVTDFFMPNEEEFVHLFGGNSVEEAMDRLPARRGNIAVKLGAKGCLLIRPDGETVFRPSFPVQPVDTTGAGDSFNAGLIHGIVSGMDIEEALDFANASGALAVLRIGGADGVPDRAAVEAWMRSHQSGKA